MVHGVSLLSTRFYSIVFITIVRGHIYIHAHTYIYIHADIELYSHVLYASAMSGGIIIQASAFWSLRCCHEVDSGFHVAPRLSENPKFEKLPHRFKLASPGIARSTFKERSEWTNLRYAKSLFQFFLEHDMDMTWIFAAKTCANYELCQPRKTDGCGCVHCQFNMVSI